MVIVDSDVWSEALRSKREESRSVSALRRLIEEEAVIMIGPIRQEVLSGIREVEQYEKIREIMRSFPSQKLDEPLFELAASLFNLCRGKGVQGSHSDYLICACAIEWKAQILTKDEDFKRYAKYIPLELYAE
ncbi:MAG: PIN domain-containing protein [Verrucomicrobiota bacterium]